MDERLQRERDFHNQILQDETRNVVGKYYSIAGSSYDSYKRLLEAYGRGKQVLEYGCGPGSFAFFLAERGASVVGIDISDGAIEQGRETARAQGLDIEFRLMNAEQLDFPDGSFDMVCGTGILHHLDLERAYTEVARVLRGGGVGIFLEAMGHNPIINLYRRLTPRLRTEDEHPLLMSDLAMADRYFPRVDTEFYYLFSLLAVPFQRLPFFRPLLAGLDAFDRLLFRALPFLKRYAWMSIIIVHAKPAVSARAV